MGLEKSDQKARQPETVEDNGMHIKTGESNRYFLMTFASHSVELNASIP